ncbi:hypothetical protein JI57_01460 [Psychromonas sp. PRT-SC03]|nr:hypothetical protein JI57_01460 [Psychromonas sp. PRT-SC03]
MLKNKYYLKFESFFVLSPIMCLFFGVFNVPNAKHLLSRLLVVVTLYCFFRFKSWRNKFNNRVFKCFLYSSSILAIYSIFLHFSRNYDISFSRSIIPVLLYLVFVPVKYLNKNKLFIIILLSGIITGCSAFYEYFMLSLRAGTTVSNAIPFATYASILLFTSIFMAKDLLPKKEQYKNIYYVFFMLSIIFSFSAIILSMSRGVWLATVLVSIIFLCGNIKNLLKFKGKFVLVLVFFSIICAFSFGKMLERFTETKSEVIKIEQGDRNSSIGIRLQLYQTGLNHFLITPFSGTSYEKDIQLSRKDLIDGRVTSAAYQFLLINHYHNQFIYQLVYTGILGLFLFLTYLFTLPLVLRNKPGVLRNVVVSVLLVLLIAGVTDIPFRHAHITYLFSMLMGMLIISYENRVDKA